VISFRCLNHYGFASEVKRNSASGLSKLDGLAVSAVVRPWGYRMGQQKLAD